MYRFFRIIFSLFFIGIILYGVLSIRPYRISGDSMSPNLRPESVVIIDRISPRILWLNRWDVVVYRSSEWIRIKRIIGLPKEQIKIAEWNVFSIIDTDAKMLDEKYLAEHVRTCVPGGCTDLGEHIYNIPSDHYFVLGDNRENSRDSRGCIDITSCANNVPFYVPDDEILGRVIFPW